MKTKVNVQIVVNWDRSFNDPYKMCAQHTFDRTGFAGAEGCSIVTVPYTIDWDRTFNSDSSVREATLDFACGEISFEQWKKDVHQYAKKPIELLHKQFSVKELRAMAYKWARTQYDRSDLPKFRK